MILRTNTNMNLAMHHLMANAFGRQETPDQTIAHLFDDSADQVHFNAAAFTLKNKGRTIQWRTDCYGFWTFSALNVGRCSQSTDQNQLECDAMKPGENDGTPKRRSEPCAREVTLCQYKILKV